ncbi:MAG: cell division protein FtsA [Desulfurivibrionaceae bacterium]|nr:cell division protein FtsA [Desulfobulbales bacterium]MDT8335237.1 cell division protein FtsA [Desulfurivibrionaceae bacterium]
MFSRHTLITALDIGASSTKAVIAETDCRGYVELLGHGQVATAGQKGDVINDIRELGESIAACVEKAEDMASVRAGSLVVSVGGEHVRIMNSRGGIPLDHGRGRYINRQDIKKVIDNAGATPLSADLQVLHILPINYYVDGQKVRNPDGLSGARLDVAVMIIAARQSVLNSIVKAAEYADCRVSRFCYRPLATGRAVMSSREMDMGGCLVDVGGRHTDIAVFKGGRMIFTSTLALGGENITADISALLEIGWDEAEKIKLSHGHCTAKLTDDVEFQVTGVRDGALWRTVRKSEFGVQVIQPRVEEILEEAMGSLLNSVDQAQLPGGVVLTGGVTRLPGFVGLASAILPVAVKNGLNSGLENMKEISGAPDYSTALGLVLMDMARRLSRREDVMDNPLSRLYGRLMRKIHAVI